MTPTEVLDVHYAAYGASDLEGLVATLSDDFVCAAFHGREWARGKSGGSAMYEATIRDYPLSLTRIEARSDLGDVVAMREYSESSTGKPAVDMIAIYTVGKGQITRADMVRGAAVEGGETLAQRQLDAYNRQDLDAHVACFADDIVVADLNAGESLHGIDAYRDRYAALFGQYPMNKAALVSRMSAGNVVIDHERVTRNPDADPFEVLAIYTLREGLIARVDFVK